eukprot:4519761-Pleurochrysis_carterae.AAC.1
MDQWPPWECAQNARSSDLVAGAADSNKDDSNTASSVLEAGDDSGKTSHSGNVFVVVVICSIVGSIILAACLAACFLKTKGRLGIISSQGTVRRRKLQAPTTLVKHGEPVDENLQRRDRPVLNPTPSQKEEAHLKPAMTQDVRNNVETCQWMNAEV